MIKTNGGNINAVSLRFQELNESKRELLGFIVNKSLELSAREKALGDFLETVK